MGNKLGRRRSSVDERYTRPQGLYQHRDIDRRKLRRLILDSKLAPCYAGADDPAVELDECPICFLHYPSLNRSKCCTKGICTECFLQMKSPQSVQPTQCPYCKTLNYAVEYRGLKSEEEKGLEQVEEQKVIEAKIRMQQNELEEEQQQRTPGRLQTDYLSDNTAAVEGGRSTTAVSYTTRSTTATETGFDQGSTGSSSTYFRRNRDEFDLDLEDIMVMEAIWLSIQEQNAETYIEQKFQAPSSGDISSYVTPMQGNNVNHCMELPASLVNSGDVSGMSSLTGGLAGAIAEMAERNITGGSIHETLSLDPVDGFSSLPTASDLQPDRPFTSDFFQVDDLNNLSEDRVNMAMCSNSVGDKDAQGINDKLLKAQVEGNSTTEKTHHYIYTLCCEDHDTKNFVGDSSNCQQAYLTSMGNRLKSSTEAIIASYDSAGPSKTRICTDTTSELSSQDLITPCEEPYVNAGEGAAGVSVVPKNFEDQITLAMPLAEARTDCQSQHEEESHQVSSNVI